jgi:hypothetical protein
LWDECHAQTAEEEDVEPVWELVMQPAPDYGLARLVKWGNIDAGLGIPASATDQKTAHTQRLHYGGTWHTQTTQIRGVRMPQTLEILSQFCLKIYYPCLIQTCATNNIQSRHVIAIGDGSNDFPIMGTAGLTMSYHAKPRVREQAIVAINTGALNRLLEVLT